MDSIENSGPILYYCSNSEENDMIVVTELKNGQVFLFRDVEYVCLMTFIDSRTAQVIVTALKREEYIHADISNVIGFRFFKFFEVEVVREEESTITQIDNNKEECQKYDRPEVQQESMLL